MVARAAPALSTLVHRSGQVGFVLEGVALVLVGAVVTWAAATVDADSATGLDGALRTRATGPLGPALLTVVATGLAAFAGYLLARPRPGGLIADRARGPALCQAGPSQQGEPRGGLP
ncbi:protein of unknown function [Geodermatophilus amargosae]|uniref:DUF1206 domain-containing protein n=1 Tax=Geodermatophilus amargosae TaxID=1296565 RepID=A0A1I6ZUW7_9ACTN|nr:DUF1206 domain-containing protein [Geodermatophilus amargosae]SFT66478.1 protein of unknown function [Geodermatophilus amargosae]